MSASVPERPVPPDLPALRALALRLATRMFGPGLADDVTQEAMLRLLADPRRYSLDERDPAPLLATIVRNAGIDMIRRQRRSHPYGLEMPTRPGDEAPDPVADQVIARQELCDVGRLVAGLSRRNRDLLRHLVQGGTLHEYAARQGETPNAVRQRWLRVRRCLARSRNGGWAPEG